MRDLPPAPRRGFLPSDGSLSKRERWERTGMPEKVFTVFLSGTALLTLFTFFLGQFFQIRGVQNMLTSRIFLAGAWLILVAATWGCSWIWQYQRRWNITIMIAVILLIGAYFLDIEFPMPIVVTPQPQPAPTSMGVPTVEVNYVPSRLPFFVLPSSTVYLLRLNGKLKDWPDEINNPDDKNKMKYPPKFKGQNLGFGGMAFDLYICEIKNHSDKDLVDVRMAFPISFRDIKQIPVTVSHHGKQMSMTIPTRGKDGISWAAHTPRGDAGFTEGDEILVQNRVVVLPSINAHSIGFIYVVNSSHYPTRFDLPSTATALISGTSEKQAIRLIRPNTGIFSIFPWWGMAPGFKNWKDSPNDSDIKGSDL